MSVRTRTTATRTVAVDHIHVWAPYPADARFNYCTGCPARRYARPEDEPHAPRFAEGDRVLLQNGTLAEYPRRLFGEVGVVHSTTLSATGIRTYRVWFGPPIFAMLTIHEGNQRAADVADSSDPSG